MSQTPNRSGWYTFLFLLGLLALLAGSFYGALLLIFVGVPMWVALGFPVSIGGYIHLWVRGYYHPLFSRKIRLAWLVILLGAGVAVLYPLGHSIYREYLRSISVPAEIRQWQYNPQYADNQLAKLDTPATLTLQPPYPKLDGSTALYPVYAAFAQAIYPLKPGEYYSDYVSLSKTSEAYERLFAGQVDIIFVPAPSKAHQAKAKELGITLHLTPIGKEAFVFFVNAQNPVNDLSVAQIRQIYSGALTNWRDVGGRDQRIRAFQRPENSGSQTALQKIMGDTPLQAAPREDVAAGMGGIIDRVSDYYNFSDALGYSFLILQHADDREKRNQTAAHRQHRAQPRQHPRRQLPLHQRLLRRDRRRSGKRQRAQTAGLGTIAARTGTGAENRLRAVQRIGNP